VKNRISAILGYPVEVRDDVNGTSRKFTFPGNRDEFFWAVMRETNLFDPDDSEDPEPDRIEAVARMDDDGAVIRFWSPLPAAEAYEAVAAAASGWEVAL
jgi:hypothetical protein